MVRNSFRQCCLLFLLCQCPLIVCPAVESGGGNRSTHSPQACTIQSLKPRTTSLRCTTVKIFTFYWGRWAVVTLPQFSTTTHEPRFSLFRCWLRPSRKNENWKVDFSDVLKQLTNINISPEGFVDFVLWKWKTKSFWGTNTLNTRQRLRKYPSKWHSRRISYFLPRTQSRSPKRNIIQLYVEVYWL